MPIETNMPIETKKTTTLIGKLLRWLDELGDNGEPLNEFELFLQVVKSSTAVEKQVSSALRSTDAPALNSITREQYDALTKKQFEAALEPILTQAGFDTVEAAREFFCKRLEWCRSRSRIGEVADVLLARVPLKWRSRVKFAGKAAPWLWRVINLLVHLAPTLKWSLFAGQLAAYLASGALDKLCACSPMARNISTS